MSIAPTTDMKSPIENKMSSMQTYLNEESLVFFLLFLLRQNLSRMKIGWQVPSCGTNVSTDGTGSRGATQSR
jgi:hypothetical protein